MGQHQNRLATFIAESRRARGFSRVALADALGISYAYLGHIEIGRRPVPDRLVTPLGAALGLQDGLMDDLVSAAQVSDRISDSPDRLTPLLEVATAEVRGQLPSEWATLNYDAATPLFLATATHDDEPGWKTITALSNSATDSAIGTRAEIGPLVEELVQSLDRDQLALLIELLTAAQQRLPVHQR